MFTLQQVKTVIVAKCSGKDKELQAKRDKICKGCEKYSERPVLNSIGEYELEAYCKACGCGFNKMADIKKGKNAYRSLKCPILKWPGDAESIGLTLHEVNVLFQAKDRLLYGIALVQGFINRSEPLDIDLPAWIFGTPQATPEPELAIQDRKILQTTPEPQKKEKKELTKEQVQQKQADKEQRIRDIVADVKAQRTEEPKKVQGVENADAHKAIPVDEFNRAFPSTELKTEKTNVPSPARKG